MEEALSASLLPHLILSDRVWSLSSVPRSSPVDFSLRVSLTLSATLAPTLVRPPVLCVPTASGLARLSRAHIRLNRSGQLTTPLRVAGSSSVLHLRIMRFHGIYPLASRRSLDYELVILTVSALSSQPIRCSDSDMPSS